MKNYEIVVIGGGAAGFFGAIAAAEARPGSKIAILEKNRQILTKVRISGGGRCNVTHACFDPAELVKRYPRGEKALRSLFARFQPKDTIAWFEEQGVQLKIEADGRIFPATDDSATITGCLIGRAANLGISLYTETEAEKIVPSSEGFIIDCGKGGHFQCKKILFATGGGNRSYGIAGSLGHTIVTPVPSLFTFQLDEDWLEELAGISVPHAAVTLPEVGLKEFGPLLITHWGLSGPAILKISAWGARKLQTVNYRTPLHVNWIPEYSEQKILEELHVRRSKTPKKMLLGESLFFLPKSLWKRLVLAAGIPEDRIIAQLSKSEMQALAKTLTGSVFYSTGKSTNKEEFVTCGGIDLDEINFKTMESKIVPGLHFSGEVIDIDGITGGFNFQNAWSTSWVAGQAMAASLP